jgi:hypothetical protein
VIVVSAAYGIVRDVRDRRLLPSYRRLSAAGPRSSRQRTPDEAMYAASRGAIRSADDAIVVDRTCLKAWEGGNASIGKGSREPGNGLK